MIASSLFFSQVNYLAVFAAALAYFILGALWYSVLFRKTWAKGMEEMGVKISKPDQGQMGMKMVKSFAANLLCAFSVAFIIHSMFAYELMIGIKIGIVCGCGLTLSSLLMGANWQNTKTNVLMIDAAYQVLGVLLTSVIIALWH